MDKLQQAQRWGKSYDFVRGLVLYLLNHFVAKVPFHLFRLAIYRTLFDVHSESSILLGVKFRGYQIKIGQGSVINSGTILDGRGAELRIGMYVDISPNVRIWTLDHNPNSLSHAERPRKVIIEDYVWIASDAIILPGVTLGRGCIIGSGSVVTSDIEPYAIACGIPARKIGDRNHEMSPRPLYRPWFE
jgi:acetyltransferase-like isoleucine patch superfamily enzyme